jgi:peptidoglycan-N-acetylglucosamine deacetylase
MTVVHAMSVDVEDWFQVLNMAELIDRKDWDGFELRCGDSTRRLLDLFARRDAKATFFCLGWIAERLPDLIAEIHAAGHEIATTTACCRTLVNWAFATIWNAPP